AIDDVGLVRRFVCDRLRLASFRQRFLAALLLHRLDRGLDRLADLGAQRRALRGGAAHPCEKQQCSKNPSRMHHGGPGQRMNCSWPIRPSFVSPSRCAEAITSATCSYFASLFGRRCTSGCTGWAAAARSLGSSSLRLPRTPPVPHPV